MGRRPLGHSCSPAVGLAGTPISRGHRRLREAASSLHAFSTFTVQVRSHLDSLDAPARPQVHPLIGPAHLALHRSRGQAPPSHSLSLQRIRYSLIRSALLLICSLTASFNASAHSLIHSAGSARASAHSFTCSRARSFDSRAHSLTLSFAPSCSSSAIR